MRKYTCCSNRAIYPVIAYRRKYRYIDGEKSNIQDSCYTTLHHYDQVDVTIPDNGDVVSPEAIKEAADAGTPLEMEFHGLEITVTPQDKWNIKVTGRASQVTMAVDE